MYDYIQLVIGSLPPSLSDQYLKYEIVLTGVLSRADYYSLATLELPFKVHKWECYMGVTKLEFVNICISLFVLQLRDCDNKVEPT